MIFFRPPIQLPSTFLCALTSPSTGSSTSTTGKIGKFMEMDYFTHSKYFSANGRGNFAFSRSKSPSQSCARGLWRRSTDVSADTILSMCVTAALNTSSRQYYIHAYLCSNNQWRPSFEALMPNYCLRWKFLVRQSILLGLAGQIQIGRRGQIIIALSIKQGRNDL